MLIFSPIARGAVKIWSVTPVLLVLYSLIFLWFFKVVNTKWGESLKAESKSYGTAPILLTAPITLFAILATISFAFSIYKHDSFYALLRLFAYIGLYYLIVNEFDHQMRKRLIWIAITVGGVLSLYGILQYLGFFSHSWWRPAEYPAATYVNHNHFAGYLELTIPITATLLVLKNKNRLVLAAAMVIMTMALVLTQSRGAWISLAAAGLAAVIAVIKNTDTPKRVIFIVAMAFIFMAVFTYFGKDMIIERLGAATSVKASDDPSVGRFEIWQGAAAMVRERPLTGVGIGDFDHGFYKYRPEGFNARAVFAHNDYLQAAAEIGIFAPFVMLWIFWSIIRLGFRNNANAYAFGCAVGVLSLALHAAVDFNFHIPANMILFTVWIAIISGERDVKRT